MAFVDEYGDLMTKSSPRGGQTINPAYKPPETGYTPAYAPLQESSPFYVPGWAAPYQAPASVPVPSAPAGTYAPAAALTPPPAAKRVPSSSEMETYLLNSPYYKQGMETLNAGYDTATRRAAELADIQQRQAAMEEERARRNLAIQQKAIDERLGGRGMYSSGQRAFELNASQFTFDDFLADLRMSSEARQKQSAYDRSQLDTQVANDRLGVLSKTAAFYKDLWWDPETGVYRGPGA